MSNSLILDETNSNLKDLININKKGGIIGEMVLELKKSNDAQQTKMSEDMDEKNDHVPENCKVASYLGFEK